MQSTNFIIRDFYNMNFVLVVQIFFAGGDVLNKVSRDTMFTTSKKILVAGLPKKETAKPLTIHLTNHPNKTK